MRQISSKMGEKSPNGAKQPQKWGKRGEKWGKTVPNGIEWVPKWGEVGPEMG